MSSVIEHYENLLAPVYTWMLGGSEAAFALGESDLASVLPSGQFAIDLGAGFGMHTIPLARAGWRILAIDSSPTLLDQLSGCANGLSVDARCGELLRFAEYLPTDERADVILCMGDTLTHLETPDAIPALSRTVAACLVPGGRFVATFRDYSRLPSGEARFIPVRADEPASSRVSSRRSETTSKYMICFTSVCATPGSPVSAAIANSVWNRRQFAKYSWLQVCGRVWSLVQGEW